MSAATGALSRPQRWCLIALLAIGALVRLWTLDADPHQRLQRGYIYDEGEYQKNARQLVLFGQWQLDDYNPQTQLGPVHAVALAGIYRAFGVGLWQARLPQALGGILTCVLIFVLVRRALGPTIALWALAFHAIGFFGVVYERSGFTDSIQLPFIVTMIFFGVAALGSPIYGVLAGAAAAGAMLAKPTAAIVLVIVALIWAAAWMVQRRDPSSPWKASGIIMFGLAFGVIVLIDVIVVVIPNWSEFVGLFQIASGGVFDSGSRATQYVRTTFLPVDAIGMASTGFVETMIGPLAIILLFAIRRLLGTVPQAISVAERTCWIWLVAGLGYMSIQRYQPDRRFLFLLPAVAVLSAVAIALWRETQPPRLTRWRTALTGSLIGGFAGFYLGLALGGPLQELADSLGRPLSLGFVRSAVFTVAVLAGLGLGAPVAGILSRWAPRIPIAIVAVAILAIDFSREALFLARPTYTHLAATRSIAAFAEGLPDDARHIFGGEANTMAIASRLIGHGQHQTGSGDPGRTYRPALYTVSWQGRHGLVPPDSAPGVSPKMPFCRSFALSPVADWHRFLVGVYIREDLVARCAEWTH